MNYINKKVFFLFLLLNSIVSYGNTLSEILNNDSKYETLDNYGVVSAGVEQLNIDLLTNNLEVEKGFAKKLDIHLFGYSLYAKSRSNYTDLTLVSPILNGAKSIFDDNRSQNLFPSRISLRYKSLDYKGDSTGKFDSYTVKYFWDYEMYGSFDLLKLDYVSIKDDNIDNYANYYSLSFGATSSMVEGKLIWKLSKGEKLPYGFDYGLKEGGVHVGYAWANGKNPKILLGKGMWSTTRKEDDKYESFIYDVEYSPSLFFTFPIGYVKVAYTGKYSPFNESFSTHGLISTVTMVF